MESVERRNGINTQCHLESAVGGMESIRREMHADA